MNRPESLAPLRLNKGEERRLRAGHLWAFSNEIDTRATPLDQFEPGQPVEVQASNGRRIGNGYVNPHSLICARLLHAQRTDFDKVIAERLDAALRLRERYYAAPYYRLVNSEGDLLPGLSVDRFDDALVVQLTTAGMERQRDVVLRCLRELLPCRSITLRNDAPVRELEGLELYVSTSGDRHDSLRIEEGECRFDAPLHDGQKTGWYFDQSANRLTCATLARGQRVLDVYSYLGAWGIQAARAGATEVRCIDSSALAIEGARRNAELNDCGDRVSFEQADAGEALQALARSKEFFDLVVLDPPPLIRRRKDARAGRAHYQRINRLAMRVLRPYGLLVSCSCSYHMPLEQLRRDIAEAARQEGCTAQLLWQGQQGWDHPRHPMIPETAYLKALCVRLVPN